MHPLRSLLAGDEAAFRTLVLRYHRSLVRVALSFVRSESVAEEVTQETWLAVMWGLRKFEGRSSLKTWIFHILINQARSRGVKEQRSVPFSALDPEPGEQPTVDPGRFAEMSEQMRCNLVVELLTDYIEGALDDATAQRGDDHLAICPPCVVFLEQLRTTSAVLGQLSSDALPPATVEALESAFRLSGTGIAVPQGR